jgi:hypothetical protein
VRRRRSNGIGSKAFSDGAVVDGATGRCYTAPQSAVKVKRQF